MTGAKQAEQDDVVQPFQLADDIWMPIVFLLPIIIFLAIFFLLLACSRDDYGIDYFHRNNNRHRDEAIPNGDFPHATTSV